MNIYHYEICLKIVYKYKGYISPSCSIIKSFYRKCKDYVKSQFMIERNIECIFTIENLEICSITPIFTKIHRKKKQKWIIYNYTKKFSFIITCYIEYSLKKIFSL